MNILFYFETHKNLRSQNLGGIEILNIDLYNQIKKAKPEKTEKLSFLDSMGSITPKYNKFD